MMELLPDLFVFTIVCLIAIAMTIADIIYNAESQKKHDEVRKMQRDHKARMKRMYNDR